MATGTVVTGEIETAKKLVDLLERDGFRVSTAVWATDGDGRGRLYLVPADLEANDRDELRNTVRVAYTISAHKDELPDRHDLKYSIVGANHPVINAVRSASAKNGKLQGLYGDGAYIDTAYVLRLAA